MNRYGSLGSAITRTTQPGSRSSQSCWLLLFVIFVNVFVLGCGTMDVNEIVSKFILDDIFCRVRWNVTRQRLYPASRCSLKILLQLILLLLLLLMLLLTTQTIDEVRWLRRVIVNSHRKIRHLVGFVVTLPVVVFRRVAFLIFEEKRENKRSYGQLDQSDKIEWFCYLLTYLYRVFPCCDLYYEFYRALDHFIPWKIFVLACVVWYVCVCVCMHVYRFQANPSSMTLCFFSSYFSFFYFLKRILQKYWYF